MKPLILVNCCLLISATTFAASNVCKCTIQDSCWPGYREWLALNDTLNGALIRTVPPGSVCYHPSPMYNPSACETLLSQWFNSSYHASNPVSIDYPIWTNNSCNPIYPNGTSVTGDPDAGKRKCTQGSYPVFLLDATTPEQISTALSWAGERNIRGVVKATGHSYQGRSTGKSSLSIWTHRMRGIEYLPSFIPTSCPSYDRDALTAVRVAAGHTNIEVQEEVAKYGMAIVTGANPSVGIVGWLTGGGHGPLSTSYGMGADNLLEATIVTPNGKILLANPCVNSELFSAIRGGGGGTFGVVTEVVIRAFPTQKTTSHTFKVMSLEPDTSKEYYDFLGFLHKEMPNLKEGGMQGYYYIVGPPIVPTLSFQWIFVLLDRPKETVEALMEPIEEYLDQRKELFSWTSNVSHTDTYLEMHKSAFQNEDVANGNSAYGSRLLSPKSLADAYVTAKVCAKIGPSNDASKPNAPVTNPLLIGHMIASPTLPSYYPSLSSLNPSWRNTLTHLIVVSPFPDTTPRHLIDAVYADITHNKTQALRDLDENTGAYFNEADSYEPDWQKSFWGKGYERLLKMKEAVDQKGILWCRGCVGSEGWEERGDGKLCRVGGGEGHEEL